MTSSVPAVAQFVQQGPKLKGTGAGGNPTTSQGQAVGISADGNTAILGAPQGNGLWIFTRSGKAWSQQGPQLVPTGVVGTTSVFFGLAVALSADGNTALAGASGDNNHTGAAWVFTRSGSTWTQQGPKLVVSPACSSCGLGSAVALSADGNTAIVGGSSGNPGSGAVVFTRTGSTWTQQGSPLIGTGPVGTPGRADSLALSADGNLALVGSYQDGSGTGTVWTFTRSGSTWTQVGEKLTTGVANAQFGESVALSADGNTAAIGSLTEFTSATLSAVRVFTRTGSTWTQQGPTIFGTGGASQLDSVSLSGDGNLLLAGGGGDALKVGSSSYVRGAVWMFARSGGTWSQIGPKLRGRDICCQYDVLEGWAVALASDGRTAIVGAPGDYFGGAARIYTPDSDLLRGGDADGDRRSEITVYETTLGVWSSLTSASSYTGATNIGWGGTGYTPVPGDYDGDGKADLGLYQQSSGYWYVLLSGANFTTTLSRSAGGSGWLPVPGDYDGDGKTDLAVYNPSTGQWYALKSENNYTTTLNITYGGAGYQAVPGDFDGDGRTDIGVYATASGTWSVLLSGRDTGSEYTTSLVMNAGGTGWVPVQADYDGDGRTDVGVYNVSTGLWYARKSSTDYTTVLSVSWGGTGYTPIKGDYDGDGKADLALYVQSTGAWYILLSSANYTTTLSKNWGGAGYTALQQFP